MSSVSFNYTMGGDVLVIEVTNCHLIKNKDDVPSDCAQKKNSDCELKMRCVLKCNDRTTETI